MCVCVCVFVCVEGVCVCAHLGVSASIATSFKTEYRHAHTHTLPPAYKSVGFDYRMESFMCRFIFLRAVRRKHPAHYESTFVGTVHMILRGVCVEVGLQHASF